MRILRLTIDGFGPLKGRWDFDRDKLCLLVDDNERGKSTLLAAITAGLYGLDDDKRTHRVMTPLDRWRPWLGGPYRLELDVDAGDERYSIRRDFEANTVQVMNARGQDVTNDFRHGKDEYRVGHKLLGLDAEEFEKCALVRQGELDQVVPGDDKTRRASTLHARLENAADTHVGDTNATEAIQVLDGALRRYTCAELETTGTVDNAIKALEAKAGQLETEIATLERDLAAISGPAEELAALAEEERETRETLGRLDTERRGALAGDVQRQLDADQQHRAALQKLKDEARSLESAAHVPVNAEAELRETVARYEEAQRNLDTSENRRKDDHKRERGGLEAERDSLKGYAGCDAADADRLVAAAAEIRRLREEEDRLKTDAFSFRDTLAGKGYEPERVQFLLGRFGTLPEDEQKLLRNQAGLALAFQTEVAGLERVRTESTETLRAIDAQRNAQRMPGWILLALGLGVTATGAVIVAMRGQVPMGLVPLVGGGLGLLGGIAMLLGAAGARGSERDDSLQRLSDAQRRLNHLRGQRAEADVALGEISRRFSYRDPVELMREWADYARLAEEFGPMLHPAERIDALKEQLARAMEDARMRLQKIGDANLDPDHLETVSKNVRRLAVVKERLGESEKSGSRGDEEKRVAEALVNGLKDRALAMLRNAGLTYDPARSWALHFTEIGARSRDRARLALLTDQLIPEAGSRLRPAAEIEQLRAQLKQIEKQTGGSAAPAASGAAGAKDKAAAGRSAIDIEQERDRQHAARERIEKRRGELRVKIDEASRRYHAEHPEKQSQRERMERALAHARRFKQAAELARDTIQKVALDTHRRWAEHLNQRVAELLKAVGTRVVELRFGEDLDFNVRFWNGQPVARGRAVQQLSSGARDQLHLAVRLAVAEYLSRGPQPLPFLVDDAFSTSDDDRARAGMKLLIEHFSRRHQILMVTCHRKRFESLAALDPDLYRERVQLLELRNANVTG